MQRLVPGCAWGCCWFKFEFCGLGVFCWETGGCEKLCWGCCWKLLLGLCTTFMGLWDSGCWLKFCGRPPWPNSKSFRHIFIQRPYSKTRTYEIGGLAAAAAEAEEETRSDSPAAFGRWKHQDLANGPSEYKHWQLLITAIEEFRVSCRTWRTRSCSRACNSWNCKVSCCSRLSRSACMASNCSASGDPRTANWRCTWRFCNRKRVFAGAVSRRNNDGISLRFIYFLAQKMWNHLFCNHRGRKALNQNHDNLKSVLLQYLIGPPQRGK